jgi:hypothetical protein
MRKVRRGISWLFLVTVMYALIGGAFWLGLVPQRWSPFPPLALSQPANWFLDPRLAALRFDKSLCRAVLTPPHIEASLIEDQPIKDGCGWTNAVRVKTVGGARINIDKISCEMAAGLALWVAHDVQPAAMKHFGKKVASVRNFGTFSCRNIIGSPTWKGVRSQHATANAMDISGFVLEDGTEISLIKNWKAPEKHAAFLRDVHQGSCRLFRASLSPEYNDAHKDHFHFDRGPLWTCE